ncbi:MAG: bifunctional glycosyltransferase family 2/GtrA family protein [Clostridia bacterium]|nr:bifunctional glycosyltransferase family 2/GtrA family protein [Clostridia bacterium]
MDLELNRHTAVIIPAYKPDDRLPPYVAALKEAGVGKIVIVDDGSGEDFAALFAGIPQDEVTHIISYTPNAGKGVALKRGMQYLQDECPEMQYAITADSDGQHTVTDVLRMAESLRGDDSGLLLGSRDFDQPDVPFKSRNGNKITSTVFKLLYGVWVSDTQTGLRGFSTKLLPTMIAVKGERYEYEMNMLIECAHQRLPMRALPIETVYENNNEGSHFRAVRDSVRIYSVILAGFFKFISASLASFLIDYGLYLLFNLLLRNLPGMADEVKVLFLRFVPHITIATVAARILSGLFNFTVNRKFVFGDKGKVSRSFPRYLVVFFANMILSAALTSGLHLWLGWSDSLTKIPVDILLFFLSYKVQQSWVFAPEKKETTDA